MKIKLILMLMFVMSTIIYARINENYIQLEKRYGSPIIEATEQYWFSFKGFIIYVRMDEGKAMLITFDKKEDDIVSDNIALTEDEIKFLLESNLGKGYEELKISDYTALYYKNGDLHAKYSLTEKRLVITDMKKSKKIEQKYNEENKKMMEGF